MNSDEFYEWLHSKRKRCINLVASWASDFSETDCEHVFSDLEQRLLKHGIETLGEPTERNLFHHLRREKENYRRKKEADKRGDDIEKVDINEHENHTLCTESVDFVERLEIRDRVERAIRQIEKSLTVEQWVLLLAIEKAHASKGAILFDFLSEREKRLFLPAGFDISAPYDMAKDKILKRINRPEVLPALKTKLRSELRKLD